MDYTIRDVNSKLIFVVSNIYNCVALDYSFETPENTNKNLYFTKKFFVLKT